MTLIDHQLTGRIKPVNGQLQMFGLPPVLKCGLCHRRLKDERSRKRGYGPVCYAVQAGRLKVRHYCGYCGKRLYDIDVGSKLCPRCGNNDYAGFRVKKKYYRARKKPQPHQGGE